MEYEKSESFIMIDNFHVLGDANTHWKMLANYIDIGFSILSPGDLFIHFFMFLILFYSLKGVKFQKIIKNSIKTKDD